MTAESTSQLRSAMPRDRWNRIYAVVRRIPRGRVATYGQVARVAGLHNAARQVGYALHALRDGTAVPWHRVLNARGGISMRAGAAPLTQRLRLEREGVEFDQAGRVKLAQYGWRPRAGAPAKPGAHPPRRAARPSP